MKKKSHISDHSDYTIHTVNDQQIGVHLQQVPSHLRAFSSTSLISMTFYVLHASCLMIDQN